MAMLKKAATIAVVAGAGVMGTAGMASAYAGDGSASPGGDNAVEQSGLIAVNALNNVNISPNLGCLADNAAPDLTGQSLVGLVPIGVSLNHLLEHANLNVLANGNTTTDVYDNSCTSNQGSSQAGNNSHGSTGAGSSSSSHSTGNGAGSHNRCNGAGAGGLVGGGMADCGGTSSTPVTAPPTTSTVSSSTAGPIQKPYIGVHAAGRTRAAAPEIGTLAHTGANIEAPLAGAGAAMLGGFALQLASRKRGSAVR